LRALGLILGKRNPCDHTQNEKRRNDPETAQNHLTQGLILPPAGNRTPLGMLKPSELVQSTLQD
jgi:hypothetical protein